MSSEQNTTPCRASLCCLAALLVACLFSAAVLLVTGSNPVCFKFDCASNGTKIVGKLIRYPKKLGVRKFSEDRDLARADEALKLGRVFLRSLHFDSGLFSARMFRNESATFSEFLVLCPKFLLQENRRDCFFPDFLPDSDLKSWKSWSNSNCLSFAFYFKKSSLQN